jgi:lipopolysaccharide transport system ATP-binding protein
MAVIEFEHVSKTYRLGTSRTSLREAIPHVTRKLFSRNSHQRDNQLFWALNDVSFKVEQGEVLGIVGPNGAGKSTTLKLLSKVTFPTSGQIRTRGRMAALIELGAGFHPDLSGRENVYLNGSILGLKRQEIDAAFSDIVEFSELEHFIDTPVKRYSSGMYVRLAFAVAAYVKADLLLIDEVLSVGDMAFQQKCITKMNELRDSGAAVVFVSHNMWSVSTFCRRALLLRAGQIEAEGMPDEVIEVYQRHEREDLLARSSMISVSDDAARSPNGLPERPSGTLITKVELLNQDGQPEKSFDAKDQLLVRVHFIAPKRLETAAFVIQIRRADGLSCCALASDEGSVVHSSIYGQGTIEALIGPLQLVPDLYTVEIHIIDSRKPLFYARSSRETFRIKGNIPDHSYTGVFQPRVEWQFQNMAGMERNGQHVIIQAQ